MGLIHRLYKWFNTLRYGVCECGSPNNYNKKLSFWAKKGDYRACDFCGSVHPDDLIDHMRQIFIKTNSKYMVSKIFGRTSKTYKFYVDLPGKNAPIKFYMWHLSSEQLKEMQSLLPPKVDKIHG